MSNGTPFNEYLLEKLKDPDVASHFIAEAIKKNDCDYLKIVLDQIEQIHGVELFLKK